MITFNYVDQLNTVFEWDIAVGEWFINADQALCCDLGEHGIAFPENGDAPFVYSIPYSHSPILKRVSVKDIEYGILFHRGVDVQRNTGPWYIDKGNNLWHISEPYEKGTYVLLKLVGGGDEPLKWLIDLETDSVPSYLTNVNLTSMTFFLANN